MKELKVCPSQWEKAVKLLNAYRNAHYADILTEESYALADAINTILPFAVHAYHHAEQVKSDTKTDGLIKELRNYGLSDGSSLGRHMGIMDEAADRLEELSRRVEPDKDNTQTPKEQADVINNYKQMSQALKKQKEQNVQMRKMLDRLKKALGVACSMQLDRILPSDIKAVVNIVLHEAEKYDSTLVEGLCCDCFYDKKGFCGDYSENDNCHYKKKDGSCWKPHK